MGFFGNTTIVESDPPVLEVRDGLFVPSSDQQSAGAIFDHGRKLVLQSAYFRGPEPTISQQAFMTTYDVGAIKHYAPDDVYVYVGTLMNHFGHMLLSTFSRFWCPLWRDMPHVKLVYHGSETMDDFLARHSWFARLMQTLELDAGRFVTFDKPTRMRRLLVPAPSFQESNFAHRVYATFCNDVGRALAGNRIGTTDVRPVFLSKGKLRSGVRKVVNEDVVSDVLERHGVEIVHPEMLDMADQVAVWFNRPYVCSFAGSAMHASIFAPGRNITCINDSQIANSSFFLSDEVNNARAQYYGLAQGDMVNEGADESFLGLFRLADPVGVAECLLRSLDFQQQSGHSRGRAKGEAPVRQWHHEWPGARLPSTPPDRPAKTGPWNLALDRPSRQSSRHPWVPVRDDGATNGSLTGTFQFHTDFELSAWWQIDLGAECFVEEIRIFNRCDEGQDRLKSFEIVAGPTEDALERFYMNEDHREIGGLAGTPFTAAFERPVRCRIVRIVNEGVGFLHFDQVEVIGHPVPAVEKAQRRTLRHLLLRGVGLVPIIGNPAATSAEGGAT